MSNPLLRACTGAARGLRESSRRLQRSGECERSCDSRRTCTHPSKHAHARTQARPARANRPSGTPTHASTRSLTQTRCTHTRMRGHRPTPRARAQRTKTQSGRKALGFALTSAKAASLIYVHPWIKKEYLRWMGKPAATAGPARHGCGQSQVPVQVWAGGEPSQYRRRCRVG